MTTLERALIDPPMLQMRQDHSNDNVEQPEPEEGLIDDPDQMQFLYPLNAR